MLFIHLEKIIKSCAVDNVSQALLFYSIQKNNTFPPFTLNDFFSPFQVAYGLFAPFLFFSVICVVNIIFTAKCVPETKGQTLEEIENYFRT